MAYNKAKKQLQLQFVREIIAELDKQVQNGIPVQELLTKARVLEIEITQELNASNYKLSFVGIAQIVNAARNIYESIKDHIHDS